MIIEGAFGSGLASRIVPHLWQGGFPIHPEQLNGPDVKTPINLLVLTAAELLEHPEETASMFSGMRVITAPFVDGPLDKKDGPMIIEVAKKIAEALKNGERVLICCHSGRNRSGLLSALALTRLYGISGDEARAIVQSKRPKALTNKSFCKFLSAIPRTK